MNIDPSTGVEGQPSLRSQQFLSRRASEVAKAAASHSSAARVVTVVRRLTHANHKSTQATHTAMMGDEFTLKDRERAGRLTVSLHALDTSDLAGEL